MRSFHVILGLVACGSFALASAPAAHALDEGGKPVVTKDPDLERGFPVMARISHGGGHVGPEINAVVANLDDDRDLEICGTMINYGPVTCWNSDGTVVRGWRKLGSEQTGTGFVSVGPLARGGRAGVVTVYDYGGVTATTGARRTLRGWPIEELETKNTRITPSIYQTPSGDPVVVIGDFDGFVHSFDRKGRERAGWPVGPGLGPFSGTAVADVDGDGAAEVFAVEGGGSTGRVYAYHDDGTALPGYPISVNLLPQTYPSLGDVDGDGAVEMIIAGEPTEYPWAATLFVFDAATGALEGTKTLGGQQRYVSAVALADLDHECSASARLEIVVQTMPTLEVVTWDGHTFADRPGFPVTWGDDMWTSSSAPVVGDLDGDGVEDIAFTGQVAGDGEHGKVFAYNANGTSLGRFPKTLVLGTGGVPAIADVDNDGRNELVVKGYYFSGQDPEAPSIWVYDLRGGPTADPQWGQFQHDPARTGAYQAPCALAPATHTAVADGR